MSHKKSDYTSMTLITTEIHRSLQSNGVTSLGSPTVRVTPETDLASWMAKRYVPYNQVNVGHHMVRTRLLY